MIYSYPAKEEIINQCQFDTEYIPIQSIRMIHEKDVFSLFIGKGGQIPDCENILFIEEVSHERVPLYLNAADAFVLPTMHEGCCNAVVEAMACGLPIISSNLPFNWDVLDNSNSIMVNPSNLEMIADAIKTLRDNVELHDALSKGALRSAENLSIERRVESIMSYISSKMI